MKKFVFAAMAALVMASVSSVFASKAQVTNASVEMQDTTLCDSVEPAEPSAPAPASPATADTASVAE